MSCNWLQTNMETTYWAFKIKISKSLANLFKFMGVLNYKALYIIHCTPIIPYSSYDIGFKTTIN